MRAFQKAQNRSHQTAAVIQKHVPDVTVINISASGLLDMAAGLDGLVQTCEKASADARQARSLAKGNFQALRELDLRLPQIMKNALRDEIPAESALLALLPAIFAIVPRTPALAIARARLVVVALARTNDYLATLAPPRPPVTAGGDGLAELSALIAARPKLEQDLSDAEAGESAARSALRNAVRNVDRFNKRFYKKLQAEARENPALAAALGQIAVEKPHRRPKPDV